MSTNQRRKTMLVKSMEFKFILYLLRRNILNFFSMRKNHLFYCLFCILMLFTTGCLTSIKLANYTAVYEYNQDMRFLATKGDLEIIDNLFVENLLGDRTSWQLKPIIIILLPFPILDLPLSLVTDIITFPIDQYLYYDNKTLEKIRQRDEKRKIRDEKERKKIEENRKFLAAWGNRSVPTIQEETGEKNTTTQEDSQDETTP